MHTYSHFLAGFRYGALALLMSTALWANGAMATTSNKAIKATTSVSAECKVWRNGDIAFGAYDPLVANKTTPLDAQVQVTAWCTLHTPGIYIALAQGNNASGTSCSNYQRRMKGAATGNLLNYGLYQDSARTVPWLCQAGVNTYTFPDFQAPSAQQSTNIYARIPAGQNAAKSDSYSDQLTVTIFF